LNCTRPAWFFPNQYAGPVLFRDSRDIAFALIQCKLSPNVEYSEAKSTVDPSLLYLNNKSSKTPTMPYEVKLQKSRELVVKALDGIPCFRIVVKYPDHWPQAGKPIILKRGSCEDLEFALSGDEQLSPLAPASLLNFLRSRMSYIRNVCAMLYS